MQKAPRKQPVQSRSQATYDAITEATIQVLLKDGWASLTTTRVAERAGVSVGTLYQYFPNKRALVEVVRARYFELMSETMGRAIADSEGHDIRQVLHGALGALVAGKRDNLDLSKALAAAPSDATHADFASEIVDRFAGVLVPILALHAADLPRTVIEERAGATVAAVEGLLSYAVKNRPDWLAQTWFTETLGGIVCEALSGVIDRPADRGPSA